MIAPGASMAGQEAGRLEGDMRELGMTPEVRELRERVRVFMEEYVYPGEPVLDREDDEAEALLKDLQARVKTAGMWAPFIGPEAGGTGRGFLPYAYLNEVIGRSFWAQLVFGCQAPDTGNAEILHLYGTQEQRERWLYPLVAGEIRSYFAMTEPEVSGADPTGLRSSAVVDGDHWVIDGHKWFSSGAEGAALAIVMVVTEPEAPPHRRMSQIIVPADTPGVEVVRAVPTMGHRGRGWTTHCEVRFDGARVPLTNLLGERGDGFRIAQKRLGPGRIHHVMRWLGQMQRAFELLCARALEREAFGGPLADKQTVQNWIADSVAEIQACRLLTLDAAYKIDQGDEARVEISVIKFYAARVLHEVIDRAVQVHGALGLTDQTPLSSMYRQARAARVYDGPDEVHRMVVSRRVLRAFAAGQPWDFAEGGPR
jgi:alkylation response protein AidB-like acyl-CoA dehydrogenase